MPRTTTSGDEAMLDTAFDARTAVEISQRAILNRIGFAAVFAAISLLVLPWMAAVAWVSTVVVWELIVAPPLDRAVVRLPEKQASAAHALLNMIGTALYCGLPFLCLAEGSPVGVAIATTWIAGSILHNFVYASADRRLLLMALFPIVVASIVGPFLAYGFNWRAAIMPAVFGLYGLSAQQYSLDRRALLGHLADRQVAVVDLERKLSVAIEASGDGLYEVDLITDEVQVSPTWLTMLGYGPGDIEVPIKGWHHLVHPDDLETLVRGHEAHFAGETPHTACELRHRCKSGEYKWVLARSRLIARTPDGQPWRLIGTTIDLSARKALEHQLEAARDLAERANHAKSVFVANMSHEIRTPLNGVIGVAGALAGTGLSMEQQDMVALIQSSAQMLERMMSDILDQAKMEAGNFQLQTAPFDLRREVESAAELMRPRAEEKGLKFDVTYTDAADGEFAGDAVRLKQIISNLVSNAIKFTASGGVTVKVKALDPVTAGQPTLIRIEVADTGIGFDAETASRLFSRFVQADGSISREFGGTGLGLAICKALAELMGGRVSARSEPGQGSVFRVEIPLPRSVPLAEYRQHGAGAKAPRAAPAALALPLLTMRILLVEDHPINQQVVQYILKSKGVALTTVGNGRQAVEAWQAQPFDVILMDMQMPVMDGLAATREIRRLERLTGRAPTPIAMLSANAQDEHLALANEAGADHHVAKPFTPEQLLAGIEAAVSRHRQATPADERVRAAETASAAQ